MNLKPIHPMTVARSVISSKITLVKEPLFTCLYDLAPQIEKVDGDIVEAGVWQGGYSIFMAKLFPNRVIWMCDSFDGFQPPEASKYRAANPADEVHNPNYAEWIKAPLDAVLENLNKYNLKDSYRVKILEGWVKDTLNKETCPIEKVAVLRVDVDAYGATYEVLENMYDKVSSGGVIIFDDYGIDEAREAIHDYFKNNNIDMPPTVNPHEKYNASRSPDGTYIIKP